MPLLSKPLYLPPPDQILSKINEQKYNVLIFKVARNWFSYDPGTENIHN